VARILSAVLMAVAITGIAVVTAGTIRTPPTSWRAR
jgi:hypothetical protein